jgi:hypothetical protein
VILLLRFRTAFAPLAQAEEGQDGQDNDDKADEINKTVHEFLPENCSALRRGTSRWQNRHSATKVP